MRIAIIMPRVTISQNGGVELQCRMWRDGLEKAGHHADLIGPWEQYDFSSYDFILFVGLGYPLRDFLDLLGSYKAKFVIAPVIDYHKSIWKFVLRIRFLGTRRLIRKPLHDLYLYRDRFEKFFIRSEYEKSYLKKALGLNDSKFEYVPISLRMEIPSLDPDYRKEDFCFHVSRLDAFEKNVNRLVGAAVKYGFKLVLAGKVHGDNINWLHNLIDGHDNITYVGVLDDATLNDYYKRAKVFALPSIIEGVGMVALEAAANGCNIVLTEIGGPKEYFDGKALLVNPYDIDDIGKAVVRAMYSPCGQPELSEYVRSRYDADKCISKLARSLESLL